MKFYCATCKKIKRRKEIKRIDDGRSIYYSCKWCHKNVVDLDAALEKVLVKNNKLFKYKY